MGSNDKHHGLLHWPQQVLNLLADCGIATSIEEMMIAAGAGMWESKMFTKDQMVT